MTGLALGLAAGFVGSLLRRRAPGVTSGYLAPVAASGPQAVPPPAAGPVLQIVRFSDDPATSSAGEAAAPQPGRPAGPPAGEQGEPGAVLRIRLPGDTAVG